MELNLKKEAVASCELLLDSAAEQTIECDVLLPDYCPDIVRVLCCSVDAAARKVIADAGFGEHFGHGYGHGIGLAVHEQPNCSPSWKEPLPAGCICSAEPGIYLPGKFGVRIEDMVFVKENGVLNLTASPKNLIIV